MASKMDEDDFLEAGGISDDSGEEETQDDHKHAQLLEALSSLDGKKRMRDVQRTEAISKVSEYHLSSAGDKVKLHELVGALRNTTSHADLKHKLNRVKRKGKVLATPLSKHEQERITRSVAYEETKKEVTKWDPLVDKNRNADQLQFPLERASMKFVTTEEMSKRFQPRTPLEKEIAEMLHGSEHVLPKARALTRAEERALKAMSLQEAKERRAELKKYRALLSYKEARAHRQKKIKSKKYHRVMRKEKQKKEKQSLEELQKKDPEAYLETLKKIERERVQERASLKHRGGSRFMQKQIIYGKYDKEGRHAVQEMIQKSQELRQKVAIESESEEEGDEMEAVEEVMSDDVPSTSVTKDNPWMAPVSIKKSASLNKPQLVIAQYSGKGDKESREAGEDKDAVDEHDDDDDDDDASDDKGLSDKLDSDNIDKLFAVAEKSEKNKKKVSEQSKIPKTSQLKKSKQKTLRQKAKSKREVVEESESSSDSDESEVDVSELTSISHLEPAAGADEGLIAMSLQRKRTLEDLEGDFAEGEAPSKRSTVDTATLPMTSEGDISVDPSKLMTVEHRIQPSHMPSLVEEDGDMDEEQQRITIAQAFASDDVVADFDSEKTAAAERDKPKDIDLTLPGWGDWGGSGLSVSKRKKKRFTIKAPTAPPRRDQGINNVIISETKDRAISKHQVSELPFPFSSLHQFESSVRAPIGKTWNTETAFKQLIKPKVVTHAGQVIEPMSKAEMFKHQQRTDNKRRQNNIKKKHGKDGGAKMSKCSEAELVLQLN